jgi:dehydrogenase/reductase SDR family member 1
MMTFYRIYFILLLNLELASNVLSTALKGRVCVVTGGTRGIGRGIATGLAEQGATVWVTGRSLNTDKITPTDKKLGGTLEDIQKDINSLGGVARCFQCDHKDDSQVEALFKEIEKVDGRLDLLVNNAFQVPVNPSGEEDKDLLFRDFWEQPGWFWDSFNDVGLRSHYIASVYAVPLLKKTVSKCKNGDPNPMICHVSSFGGVSYSFNVAYGVGKAGVDRMAKDMAVELKKENIDCISVWPGVVRTERMVDILDSGDWKRRTGLGTPSDFVESPRFTGRVIAALYNEKNRQQKRNGKVTVIAEAAKELNVIDMNSSIPPSIRSLKFLIPSLVYGKIESRSALLKSVLNLVPDILLPMSFMEGGPPPISD